MYCPSCPESLKDCVSRGEWWEEAAASSQVSWAEQEGLDPLLLCMVPFDFPSALTAMGELVIHNNKGSGSPTSQHVQGF